MTALKCNVTLTYEVFDVEHEEYYLYEGENDNKSKQKNLIRSPFKLMDCKDWSDNRDEGWKQQLRFFEEALKKIEHVGGGKKPCIEPLQKNIAWLKKQLDIKWCKEDCTSCAIKSASQAKSFKGLGQ